MPSRHIFSFGHHSLDILFHGQAPSLFFSGTVGSPGFSENLTSNVQGILRGQLPGTDFNNYISPDDKRNVTDWVGRRLFKMEKELCFQENKDFMHSYFYCIRSDLISIPIPGSSNTIPGSSPRLLYLD